MKKTLVVCALLSLGLSACGGASSSEAAPAHSPAPAAAPASAAGGAGGAAPEEEPTLDASDGESAFDIEE